MTPVERPLAAVVDGHVAGLRRPLRRQASRLAVRRWRRPAAAAARSGSAPAAAARPAPSKPWSSRSRSSSAIFATAAGEQGPGAEAGEEDQRDAGRSEQPQASGEAFGVRFFGEREDRHRDVGQRFERVEARTGWRSKTEVAKISGAVSPAARATASTVEVTIPPSALGRITPSTGAPAADPERVGGFAQAVRDEQEHLLAAAGDQRQLDDRQRDRGGEAGLLVRG